MKQIILNKGFVKTQTLLLLCIFFINYVCYAQPTNIVLRGSIHADNDSAFNGCYIKVMQKGNRNILYYTNTGEKNIFIIKVLVPGKDSLIIIFGHLGYKPVIQKFMPDEIPANMDIILTLSPQLLPEVSIAQTTWKNGDTTFFKVDSFRIGDERKLKDIITKLPGFKINDEGKLEYKRKAVEKITVNGEDIFADKTSLLLENFPVHVLNTIQALENQTDNKLLKGLVAGGKVVVNLVIKKEKLTTAFGDAEAGAGTSGKYLFNPVLFALNGKLKMGFIGNYNSIGNGVGYTQENELKNPAIRLADNWMMMNSYLYTIPNFENRNYINNQQWDNRLKLNYTHTAKLKSELELDYLKDRQLQSVNNRSVLFDDSSYIERFENINNKRKPDVLLAKEKTTWSMGEKKELIFDFSTYLNNSSGFQHSVYTQNMKADTTENNLANKFKTFSGQIIFTKRVSKNSGYNFYIRYSNISNAQNSYAVAGAWPVIFKLNDDAYTNLNLGLKDHSVNFETGIELFTKTKQGTITNNIRFQSVTSDIGTQLFFDSKKQSLSDTLIKNFSNKGSYKTDIISATSEKGLRLFHLPVGVSVQYGIASSKIKEHGGITNITTPVYRFRLAQKTKYGEHFDANLDISYSNTNPTQRQFSEILLPSSFNAFHSGNITHGSIKELQINYGLGFDFLKKSQIVYLNFTYIDNLAGYVTGNSYNQFIQLSVDSFIRKPRGVYGVYLNYKPALFLKWNVDLDGGFFYNEVIYKQSTGLIHGNILTQYWHLSIKRNWNKKYFATLEGNYTGYNNRYPEGLGKLKSSGNLSDTKIALKQKLFISKHVNIFFNAESYNNNFSGINRSRLFFAETGCDFSFPKFPLMFSISAQNLLNEKQFNTVDISPLLQSFDAININRRNLFLSVRYEL